MPLGLKNVPTTFQQKKDNVVKGLQQQMCLVFMDDIIVYNTSLEEHFVNLSKIVEPLLLLYYFTNIKGFIFFQILSHFFSVPTANRTAIIPPVPYLVANEDLYQ